MILFPFCISFFHELVSRRRCVLVALSSNFPLSTHVPSIKTTASTQGTSRTLDVTQTHHIRADGDQTGGVCFGIWWRCLLIYINLFTYIYIYMWHDKQPLKVYLKRYRCWLFDYIIIIIIMVIMIIWCWCWWQDDKMLLCEMMNH